MNLLVDMLRPLRPLRPRRPRRRSLSLAGAGVAVALLLAAAVPSIALAAPSASASCNLSCLQSFGDKEIGKRLASLADATSKINTVVSKGHLTSTQATPLLNQITTNQNGLKSLQASLDAISGDTKDNETLARQDDKDIFAQYRIYAVFLPVLRHVVLLDVMTNVDQKMRAAQPKIEKAIDGDKTHQAQLNTLYSDYKTQFAEAEAQIDAAQGQLPVLTPSTFNEHNGDYQTAWNTFKSDCQNAYNALKQAKNDLHQIVTILKGDVASSNGSNSSATPAATATP